DGELSLENDLEALKECIRYIKRHRTSPEPFDVVQTVMTSGEKNENKWIEKYIDAGVTWVVECFYPGRSTSLKEVQERIKSGPPL
ncbi:MAG: hypothetical protein ACXAEU_05785, partial [Candidatus Hodarchaeales archaeon]